MAQLVLGRLGPELMAGVQQANEGTVNERNQVDSYIILRLLHRRCIYTAMTNDHLLEIVGGLFQHPLFQLDLRAHVEHN